jgi:hypothetical protein
MFRDSKIGKSVIGFSTPTKEYTKLAKIPRNMTSEILNAMLRKINSERVFVWVLNIRRTKKPGRKVNARNPKICLINGM